MSKHTLPEDDQKGPKSRRVLPRVSEAGGGLLPGIDLAHPSELQQKDDLDRIRRIRQLD